MPRGDLAPLLPDNVARAAIKLLRRAGLGSCLCVEKFAQLRCVLGLPGPCLPLIAAEAQPVAQLPQNPMEGAPPSGGAIMAGEMDT